MWLTLQKSRHQVAIAGQVSDAETGRVIAGAWVVLTQMPASFAKRLALQALQYGDRWETLGRRPDRTYTVADGYFKFIDLPTGDYTLTVTFPGAGTRYGSAKAAVTVSREGERLHPQLISVALPPTALKGQIKDAQGKPIELANIHLDGNHEDALSDAQGNYRFVALEASSPTAKQRAVTVSAQGYGSQSNLISLRVGEIQVLNFELQRKQANLSGVKTKS